MKFRSISLGNDLCNSTFYQSMPPLDCVSAVADPGGGARMPLPPPWPVKNRPKKDGCRARRLICHVSWPPPRPNFLDPLLLRKEWKI